MTRDRDGANAVACDIIASTSARLCERQLELCERIFQDAVLSH